ncbi:MAG TPA: hypothetical protein VIV12_29690 [Streptosporangiaceae bacterium]
MSPRVVIVGSCALYPTVALTLFGETRSGHSSRGPDTGPVVGDLRPGEFIVGLRFRPGAAGTVLGLPAVELRDARISLEEIWGARANEADS